MRGARVQRNRSTDEKNWVTSFDIKGVTVT